MNGVLAEEQAKMRARQVAIVRETSRFQLIEDEGWFAIVDTSTGTSCGRYLSRQYARSKTKQLNRLDYEQQEALRQSQQPKSKKTSKSHGMCWSKFGAVNADSGTPASLTYLSIRRWGFKIKTRSGPADEET